MEEKKVVELSIFDKTYTISTQESPEQITEAAKMLDSMFRDMASKSQFKNENRLAVFIALQLAFDLSKQRDSEKRITKKIESLLSLLEKESGLSLG